MDKFDLFDDFKRNVYSKVEQKDSIPGDVYNILKKILYNMEQVYQDGHCNTDSITEYIKGAEAELKTKLERIGEDRKNNEFQEVLIVVNIIEKDLEDRTGHFQIQDEQNKAIQGFEEMNLEDLRFSEKITNTLIDTLKDIQSQQNRILFSLGYSDSRIEEINDRVNGFIYNAANQEENIYEIIQNDSNELINEVKEMYEEYIQYSKQNENNKEDISENKEQTRKEEFMERINSGLSLKEQSEYVENHINKESQDNAKDTSMDLPSEIIF